MDYETKVTYKSLTNRPKIEQLSILAVSQAVARRLGEKRRPGEDFKELKIDAIIRRLARPIVVKTVQDGKFRKVHKI